jgi:solute carrier family 25 (mitochondrial S-adenosylmethionine transporter), member 26
MVWRWLCVAAACVLCNAENISIGRHLAAGAIARAISIATLYPVDTIKTRVQLAQLPTVPSMGLLFKGLTSSLAGQIPYAALSFGCYESYKAILLARMPKSMSLAAVSLAAVAGDLTGSIWVVPSEVIKQQLQAGRYSSMREAVRTIYSAEGVKGFYRGQWHMFHSLNLPQIKLNSVHCSFA